MHLKRRDFGVSHHKDGDHVILYELGIKARLAEFVFHVYDEIDHHLTNHYLCGSNLPEIFWKIPLGRAKYDPEDPDFLENSIAGKWWNTSSRFICWTTDFKDDCEVMKIPITPEQFVKLWPEASFLYEDDEEHPAEAGR